MYIVGVLSSQFQPSKERLSGQFFRLISFGSSSGKRGTWLALMCTRALSSYGSASLFHPPRVSGTDIARAVPATRTQAARRASARRIAYSTSTRLESPTMKRYAVGLSCDLWIRTSFPMSEASIRTGISWITQRSSTIECSISLFRIVTSS